MFNTVLKYVATAVLMVPALILDILLGIFTLRYKDWSTTDKLFEWLYRNRK